MCGELILEVAKKCKHCGSHQASNSREFGKAMLITGPLVAGLGVFMALNAGLVGYFGAAFLVGGLAMIVLGISRLT